MIRNSRNWSVKQVLSMINKGTILFDNPLQRPSGQWADEDKSLLIDSLFRYFMPIIVSLQTKVLIGNETLVGHDILDGKQRLTTISEYINDEFALSQCKPIKLSTTGERFDISGKKYSELPENVQEELKGATVFFWSVELEDEDDEEEVAEDLFKRLNNGKAVSKEHLALVSAPKNVQDFVSKQVKENPLFKTVAHFAEGDIKNSRRDLTIQQSIMLLTGLDYNSFAANDVKKFWVENPVVEDDILDKLEGYFVDIAEAFKHEHNKFVNKINISAMVNLLNDNNDTEKAQEFLNWYSKNVKSGDAYKRFTGAGGVKKENVKNRLKGLQELYDSHVKSTEKPITEKVETTPAAHVSPKHTARNNFDGQASLLDDMGTRSYIPPQNIMSAFDRGNY
jgi:hypothetical protein